MRHCSEKQNQRRAMLDLRRALAKTSVQAVGKNIAQKIMAHSFWKNVQRVLLYVSVRNEVDTTDLIQNALERGVKIYLPRCRPDEPGSMDIACIQCLTQLQKGAFGILEPHPNECPAQTDAKIDVAIIPGVAFDRRGRRLGYGGGYYDRLLDGNNFETCLCVGIAYDFQLVDELPCEPWDKHMNAIVTEKEEIWPNAYKP